VLILLFENPTSTPSSAGVAMSRLFGATQRDDFGTAGKPEHRKIRPEGLRDVAWRKMRVVLFGLAGVGMTELGGNDAHRHANISDAKRFNKGEANATIEQ
jgi:hypothetical protein